MKRTILIVNILISMLTLGAMMLTPAAHASSVNTPVNTPNHTNRAGTIDTLSYMLDTQGKRLNGTHALSQTVMGQAIYNVLWDGNSYETFSYDSNYIYLTEDHSAADQGANGSYTFSDGKWMVRTMAVGDQLTVADNTVQFFNVGSNSCAPSNGGRFPYVMTLQQHIPSDNLGGNLGTQDVIVMQYDYRWGTGTDYEKIYYAKGIGMVKWELYRNNQVIQTSFFNTVTNTAQTLPNLTDACINTPMAAPIPSLPTSLSGFVNTLYACVLDIKQPDTPRFYLLA